MSQPATPSNFQPDQAVRTAQIITIAMLIGVVFFLVFALFKNQFAMNGQPSAQAYFAVAVAALVFVLHLVVPGVIQNTGVRALDRQLASASEEEQFSKLFPLFQTRHIVACALLEGAAFFNLILYFSAAYTLNLVVAVALLVAMLLRIPTRAAIDLWIQDRLRDIHGEAGGRVQ